MSPVLILIDLQQDYLQSSSLTPPPGELIQQTTKLLTGCRRIGIPIIHVWTTINQDEDNRMRHWREQNKWLCRAGTNGHQPPAALCPLDGELVIEKSAFSAFHHTNLETELKQLKPVLLILAGLHVHGCIRATAMDAYQKGYMVGIASDAVASDDPLHAAITQRYFLARSIQFDSVNNLLKTVAGLHRPDHNPVALQDLPGGKLSPAVPSESGDSSHSFYRHYSPSHRHLALWQVAYNREVEIEKAALAAHDTHNIWRQINTGKRLEMMSHLAEVLRLESSGLVEQLVTDIGKPVQLARLEVDFAVASIISACHCFSESPHATVQAGISCSFQPHGVIGMVTPFNNPLAIPFAKIVPALLYGNTILWKPALPGSAIAATISALIRAAGVPPGVVQVVNGDAVTAGQVMANPHVRAVTLTGGDAAGRAAQDICGRYFKPLQAELGGNNAAIVWSDFDDMETAAKEIALAAFGFAGQRCTANRRVIIDASCYDQFLSRLIPAIAALPIGDPMKENTIVGPLISPSACERIAGVVERAKKSGCEIIVPHREFAPFNMFDTDGCYYLPTLIFSTRDDLEVVQEESFGPILVTQKARNWQDAISRCNHVRQGLVAALFSGSRERQEEFFTSAEAGTLKINQATAGVDPRAAFGGWKASGIGPAEHGFSDREFYSRTQSRYHGELMS